MSTTSIYVIAIILGLVILFFALKFGSIGGGGRGARREENPVLYWLGVVNNGRNSFNSDCNTGVCKTNLIRLRWITNYEDY